jgi:hypothetical protein
MMDILSENSNKKPPIVIYRAVKPKGIKICWKRLLHRQENSYIYLKIEKIYAQIINSTFLELS